MRVYPICLTLVLLIAALHTNAATIETAAGTGKPGDVGQPFGVEIGPDGALYICDVQNHRVLRQDRKTGKITTVAGTGKKGYSGDGGPATKSDMNEPYELRFAKNGDLYVVEMQNHIVRKIDAKTDHITTVAGTGAKGFSGDGGPAVKAQLNQPHSIALDEQRGGLFIADILNHRIRRVDLTTGTIETIAGNGEKKPPVDGSLAKGNAMIGPRALFVHRDHLWIALREGHSVWTLDLQSGKLAHISGTGKAGFGGDGTSAKEALYNGPKGIALDAAGNVFIVDTENQVIRRIDGKTRIVTTIAGAGPKSRGYGGDGGDATKAKLDRPHGVCVDDQGHVYIGDTNNHRVRVVKP
jgi:DNA-binding beta-propeller fold protein YncE